MSAYRIPGRFLSYEYPSTARSRHASGCTCLGLPRYLGETPMPGTPTNYSRTGEERGDRRRFNQVLGQTSGAELQQ